MPLFARPIWKQIKNVGSHWKAISITERALKNPAGVAVAVAIITLFGLFSLKELPVQLFPDIDLPQISVFAGWRAASPQEVESEILDPMEEVLQGLPGMDVMLCICTEI